MRAPWFHVSCCPTNVARTLASLEAYVATADEEGIQIHQYVDGEIRTALDGDRPVALRLETEYPHDGTVRITVLEDSERPWTLTLRVPPWADGAATLEDRDSETKLRAGWTTITRAFRAGEVLVLDVPVQPRWTWPDPRLDAVRGCVAVERGPLVLCLESTDLGADVAQARVRTGAPPRSDGSSTFVEVALPDLPATSWPYCEYPDRGDAASVRTVSLTPYHFRGNRGPSTMRVWMPVQPGPATEGVHR